MPKYDGNRRPYYTIEDDPAAVVEVLRSGQVLDWQPGTGSRYELALFAPNGDHLGLVCLNGGWFVRAGVGALMNRWCYQLPRGEWQGLRPLLAALGWIQDRPDSTSKWWYIDKDDRRREAEARIGHDGAPNHEIKGRYADLDRKLGETVRHLLGSAGLVVSDD